MNTTIVSMNDLEQTGRNLYKYEGKYYRLYAKCITPNGCWLVAPCMVELLDIDTATGRDIYGNGRLEFDGITGTVSAPREFLRID